MPAKRIYKGPYRARPQINGNSWHVVYQETDRPQRNQYTELIPPRIFSGKNARKMANRACANLNKQWGGHTLDIPVEALNESL